MKKLSVLSLIFLLAFPMTGCSRQYDLLTYGEDSVLNYCDDATKDIFSRDELPETLVFEQIGDSYSAKVISDPQLIQETMDAIRQMHVIGELNANTEDSSDTFVFTMENGDRCMISFWQSELESGEATFATGETTAFSTVRDKLIQASSK